MDRTNIFRRVSCLSGDILRSHCGPHPAEEDFISMLYYWLAKHLKGIKGKLYSNSEFESQIENVNSKSYSKF